MNRGSHRFGCADVAADAASMRPRFMNRGSSCRSRGTSGQTLRFNEAPIHESGKSFRFPCLGRPIFCFNEAPIHESGKF